MLWLQFPYRTVYVNVRFLKWPVISFAKIKFKEMYFYTEFKKYIYYEAKLQQ